MGNNLQEIGCVIDYIEEHLLEDRLELGQIAEAAGYSKYHLHRMFTAVVGVPIHQYIRRRRLTEAARSLKNTERPILDIALCSGYETQRSFSAAFKALYRRSPQWYRKHGAFMPVQLKYDIMNRGTLRGGWILQIEIIKENTLTLVGYERSTRKGFSVIGTCWRQLHSNKAKIQNRKDSQFLLGINDYSLFEKNDEQPVFRYIAAAQVSSVDQIPRGMQVFSLPASRYVVFTFRGKNEDSLQPVVEYIYGQWFPEAECHLNENNMYDFAKYGEDVDEAGESEIQFWVPILYK